MSTTDKDPLATRTLRRALLASPGVKLLRSKIHRRKRGRQRWDAISYLAPDGSRCYLVLTWGGGRLITEYRTITRGEAVAVVEVAGLMLDHKPAALVFADETDDEDGEMVLH